ncbi:MAG TPA: EAL domain-containing protein [Actinomycetes bacterium]|nr:EAL domain-containing protein [Actinomycetes bacterium]
MAVTSGGTRGRGLLLTLDRRTPIVVKVAIPVLAIVLGLALFLGTEVADMVSLPCSGSADCPRTKAASIALVAAYDSFLLLGVLGLVFWFVVLRPVHRIAAVARRVAAGDLDGRVGSRGTGPARDALHAVAGEFDHMLDTLREERAQLLAAQRRYQTILQTATDAFISVDNAGRVTEWNARAESMFGWPRREMLGRPLGDAIVPVHWRAAHEAAFHYVMTQMDDPLVGKPVEAAALRRDGTTLPVELTVWHSDVDGQPHLNAFLRDITERKQMEERLRHQAFHDGLTGLANRALFANRVGHALARRPDARRGIAVIFLDLDDFKGVNDTLGHSGGDEMLVEVGRRLSGCVRDGDTLSRFAGDEFAVLIEDVEDEAPAVATAERLISALTAPVDIAGRRVATRASIGIAWAPCGEGVRADEVLRDADVAMYAAKRHGKATYEIFDPAMHALEVHRSQRRADLLLALDRGQLVVQYQPYLNAATGVLAGFEALVRWTHPREGLLPPDEFVPLAEESGLIREIDLWVLRQACERAATWAREHPEHPPTTMSVNVSASALHGATLVDDVVEVLRDTGLPASRLVLEITETVMMADVEAAALRLAELKALGIRLAIDDFGTGYSSLSYLQSLPVDIVKIDRSFVGRLGQEPDQAALVNSVLELGRVLGLQSVVEGVESPEQMAELERLGADIVQGFLISRPVDAIDAEDFLTEAPHPLVGRLTSS